MYNCPSTFLLIIIDSICKNHILTPIGKKHMQTVVSVIKNQKTACN